MKIVALIDGFNFYHPLNYHQKTEKTCLQWLNYPALLSYYIAQTPSIAKGQLEDVYFFTALAHWRNLFSPNTTTRHLTYINALKHAGANVVLGNFKEKHKSYTHFCEKATSEQPCLIKQISHEEKETDVRIACKLLELAALDAFDVCLLLSADSDLVPAIETLKILYPQKQVVLVTPPSKAKIDKLKRLSLHHIRVGLKELKRFQFPNRIETIDGYSLVNPWQCTPFSMK
ncbi:MAG: NYN domain-containing protein [Vampirovibrio sp.]|nr:NYN domain-containing protein [Vampirovibrio sp.]